MTTDSVRWLWALAAVLLWLALVAVTLGVVRRDRRRGIETSMALAGSADVRAVVVAFASQTGFAEELAWMTARALSEAGRAVRVLSFADLDLEALRGTDLALFVVSTTGEGDAPDSASRVVRKRMGETADLSHLSYGLLALGDRSYRDFCGFGHAVDGWLKRSGAQALFDAVEVNDADPADIRHWQSRLNQVTGSTTAPDWAPPVYGRWRLEAREHVNPGSPGGEAWSLGLAPLDGTPDWSAGDIAEIGVPAHDGQAAPGHRAYSIASLPGDGRIELLVRLMRRPDGAPGLASGWLIGTAVIGEDVAMRVRANRGFHGPAPTTPMILVGNGTGIAGLRAHLKARADTQSQTWLMFGERTAAHDAFYDADLRAWLASGALTRLDRAFSRDVGDGRYVQALITEHAAEIAAWVARGAVIYVCGSLDGMASGVHAALEAALGAQTLIELSETGRYRRDVY